MKCWPLAFFCLVFPIYAHADIQFSGFASVVGGQTISKKDDAYLADYSLVGLYDDDLSFQPETTMGLQARANLDLGLTFTSQWVSRGLNDFNSEISYAYLSYTINPELTLQAGRKRLPLQYYSEFFDVGFAYPWIRPPADLYTWQILNYNGASLDHKTRLGKGSLATSFYVGREDSTNNRLLSTFFFNEPTNETWKNIIGIRADYSLGDFQTLISYTNFKLDRTFTSASTTQENITNNNVDFYAASFNFDNGQYLLLSEINHWTSSRFATTNWLLSVGYQVKEIMPYLAFSEFKQEEKIMNEDLEEHTTSSLGMRWNFHPQAAFKIQFDEIQDKGSLALVGDAQAITFGIDLVF